MHRLTTLFEAGGLTTISGIEAVTSILKRGIAHAQAELDRFMEYPKAAESMAEELDK